MPHEQLPPMEPERRYLRIHDSPTEPTTSKPLERELLYGTRRMSKKVGPKKKGRGSKSKSDPTEEALEKAQKDVRAFRDQLSRTVLLAETAESRRQTAIQEKIKTAKELEEVRHTTQQHTAFMVTQNEMIVSSLNNKIEKLEESLQKLNEMVKEKDDALEQLKLEFSETLTERDLKIDRLKMQLSTLGVMCEDAMLQAVEKLTNKLSEDYQLIHNNYMPWSQKTLEKIELEFLNPPFLDAQSTEYY
ncbi:hypothetical protein T265_08125 [Opisthorchis viverrini]|uniref:Coiled-coil domain-containing protein 153 n=1 Tax=Opisthorchis viverrini TaxID=6198 RepID=A0A074ZAK5_OPIVI|nr:hypothetical protein T265_08125 [Opisthorchis viverrini]KER24138.1 hypothetical protein T265_08125 [Opisthorchis viverrini]